MKLKVRCWLCFPLLLFGALAVAQQTATLQEKTDDVPTINSGNSHPSIYESWMAQDVKWIITDQERAAFQRLERDEERDAFIERFWSERDPTPDTVRNEFKDSHYQRMLSALQKFSTSDVVGWNTAQGRIYVMYGVPDYIEKRTGAPALGEHGVVLGTKCEASYSILVNSHEVWHYNQIRGIDHPVNIAFAELCKPGESVAVVDKIDADWLSRPPVPKYKLQCHGKYDPNADPNGLQAIICLENPPRVEFKDLEEIVAAHIKYHLVPYEVNVSFAKITDATEMLRLVIRLKNSDLTCKEDHSVQRAPVRIFGWFTTPGGRVTHVVEDRMNEGVPNCSSGFRSYTQSIPMLLGRYHLSLVLQDANGDRAGTFAKEVRVGDKAFEVNRADAASGVAARVVKASADGVYR